MKKIVIKLSLEDEKRKRKALKVVAAVEGVESVTVDMKDKKITVIGDADPVVVTARLKKYGFGFADLLSVGPAKEEKKEEKKPQSDAKDKAVGQKVEYVATRNQYRPYEYSVVSDENPNSCGIS